MDQVTLLSAFKHNPSFFLVALVVGAATIVIAIVAAVVSLKKLPARRLGMAALTGALVVVVIGVVGRALARSQVDAAAEIAALNDSERKELIETGYAEAGYVLYFAAALAALPLVLGGGVVARSS